MAQEYYSYDEVLKELQIEEEELKRLISDGELQAVPDGGKIKFLRAEVDERKQVQMDNATIVVTSSEDDELRPIELTEEDEDIFPSSSEIPEAELNESDMFIELGERFTGTKPLIEIDERRTPIVQAHTEEVGLPDRAAIPVRPDTEELIFEQSNDSEDELLDTGELLFDSAVSEVLPQDKEEAALFSDSEMGISGNFDDIDEASVKESLDFLENSDDDIVATATPDNSDFSGEEARRQRKTKTFAGVVVAIITLVVVFLFIKVPPPDPTQNQNIAIEEPFVVRNIRVWQEYSFIEKTTSTKQFRHRITSSGKIENLCEENKEIRRGDILATLLVVNQEKLSEKESDLKNIEAKVAKLKDYKERHAKFRKENREGLLKAIKLYREYVKKHGKKAVSMLRKEQPEAFSHMRKEKGYSKAIKKLNIEVKKLNLDSLKEEIKNLKAGTSTQILAPVNGLLQAWEVTSGTEVSEDDDICVIHVTNPMKCVMQIPEKDAITWGKGTPVELIQKNAESTAIKALVEDVYKNESTVPVTLSLEISIPNDDLKLRPGQEVELQYKKYFETLAIPENAIFQDNSGNNCVYEISKRSKALRKKITPRGKYQSNDGQAYVGVKGQLLEETLIVPNSTYDMTKDEHDIVIKEEKEKNP